MRYLPKGWIEGLAGLAAVVAVLSVAPTAAQAWRCTPGSTEQAYCSCPPGSTVKDYCTCPPGSTVKDYCTCPPGSAIREYCVCLPGSTLNSRCTTRTPVYAFTVRFSAGHERLFKVKIKLRYRSKLTIQIFRSGRVLERFGPHWETGTFGHAFVVPRRLGDYTIKLVAIVPGFITQTETRFITVRV
jgi:hypothetical protein